MTVHRTIRPARNAHAPTHAEPCSGLEAIAARAASWQCHCGGQCGAAKAAQCLYKATLDLLSSDASQARAYRLLAPLATVVACQRSREGHAQCLRFADALERGDHGAALNACKELIELAGASAAST